MFGGVKNTIHKIRESVETVKSDVQEAVASLRGVKTRLDDVVDAVQLALQEIAAIKEQLAAKGQSEEKPAAKAAPKAKAKAKASAAK